MLACDLALDKHGCSVLQHRACVSTCENTLALTRVENRESLSKRVHVNGEVKLEQEETGDVIADPV